LNGVNFFAQDTLLYKATDEEIESFLTQPIRFLGQLEGREQRVIYVLLAANLNGINGVAFSGINVVALADYTSVHDFRTLAHEIGHILNLSHTTSDESRLMHSGADGTALTQEEIITAREVAASRFSLE